AVDRVRAEIDDVVDARALERHADRMHDTDVVDHHAGVLARRARGDDEDRGVGREPLLQFLGGPRRRQVDVVLVERKHRNATRPQSARTGAADEAVGAEHDHPARFLWSGIEVLQHDDFPYSFQASSQASTKSGSPRMAGSFATSLLTWRRAAMQSSKLVTRVTRDWQPVTELSTSDSTA